MTLTKNLSLVCILASLACLLAGLAAGGNWPAGLPALAPALLMLLARRSRAGGWLPTAALVLSTGLAALGCLSGAQPFLLALGVIAALASWDLVLLENSLHGGPPRQAALFEGRHLQSLALAIGLGALGVAVGAGRAFQLSLPFGVLILLVVLLLFCLDRLIHTQVDQG
jgi:hypothetical protein